MDAALVVITIINSCIAIEFIYLFFSGKHH